MGMEAILKNGLIALVAVVIALYVLNYMGKMSHGSVAYVKKGRAVGNSAMSTKVSQVHTMQAVQAGRGWEI